jgi:hypothetical protein
MVRKALLYSAGLIALYLAVEYYTGFSTDTKAATGGATNIIKAFQGR